MTAQHALKKNKRQSLAILFCSNVTVTQETKTRLKKEKKGKKKKVKDYFKFERGLLKVQFGNNSLIFSLCYRQSDCKNKSTKQPTNKYDLQIVYLCL